MLSPCAGKQSQGLLLLQLAVLDLGFNKLAGSLPAEWSGLEQVSGPSLQQLIPGQTDMHAPETHHLSLWQCDTAQCDARRATRTQFCLGMHRRPA